MVTPIKAENKADSGQVLKPVPENIPDELKSRRQWVVWRLEYRGAAKPDKVLYNANTGQHASHSDLETWAYFPAAIEAYEGGPWHGIGFVFSSGDPYVGIDLDGVRNAETGEIEERARRILDKFTDAYTEISPSGTGVHIIARGNFPEAGRRREKWIEVYKWQRFFTVTGVPL